MNNNNENKPSEAENKAFYWTVSNANAETFLWGAGWYYHDLHATAARTEVQRVAQLFGITPFQVDDAYFGYFLNDESFIEHYASRVSPAIKRGKHRDPFIKNILDYCKESGGHYFAVDPDLIRQATFYNRDKNDLQYAMSLFGEDIQEIIKAAEVTGWEDVLHKDYCRKLVIPPAEPTPELPFSFDRSDFIRATDLLIKGRRCGQKVVNVVRSMSNKGFLPEDIERALGLTADEVRIASEAVYKIRL